MVGFDRYTCCSGEMRWRLLNVVPVMTSAGRDSTRSAAWRHAAEILFAIPAAALDARICWDPIDAARAVARVTVDGLGHEVTIEIAPSGALKEIVLLRWGKPPAMPYGRHVFGAACHGEATFDGVTIPRSVSAGWHYGTDRWSDGEFIRWTIDDATYR